MRFLALPRRSLAWLNLGMLCVLSAFGADAQSLPDRDDDGLPDAVEDRNQNGRQDDGETDWQNADTDQDGALDGEEITAGTDPLSARSWIPKRLAAWSWDAEGDGWKRGERGGEPLARFAANGTRTNGTRGGAIHFSEVADGPLRFPVREPNGRLNLRLDHGSIRLWFRPDWTWENRPKTNPRILEIGNQGNTNTGWWSWYFCQPRDQPPEMWRLEFGQNLGPHTSARYWLPQNSFEWSPIYWHELALVYHPEFSAVFHHGVQHSAKIGQSIGYSAKGVERDYLPPARTVFGDGFALGSDSTGKYSSLQGAIDNLETFNYPLGPIELFARQQLTVQIVTNAGAVRLRFTRDFGGGSLAVGSGVVRPWPLTLWRRSLGGSDWGAPVVAGLTNELWTDLQAEPGTTYEYKARLDYAEAIGSAPLPVVRHFFAGIAMPPQHQRGHVILAVDTTLDSRLKPELAQLRTNLVGDGWSVTQIEAPRHDDAKWSVNVRNLALLSAAIGQASRPGTTNVVFLIGHVTIPYSGTLAADGHDADNGGAWVCDAYYGYTNRALFTDSDTAPPGNLPGDGRFDQNCLVGRVTQKDSTLDRLPDFAVGRVDFARLPGFGRTSELELIRRYLAKDHRYRANGIPTAGRVSAHLGNPAIVLGANAAQGFSGAAFGIEPTRAFNGFNLLDQVPADLGVHFQYANGRPGQGVYDGVGPKPYFSSNFADPAREIPVTFRHVWFSYACNWARIDASGRQVENDNWVRASLGWPNHGLATFGGTVWDFAPLGGGAPLAALMTHGWEGQAWVPRFQSILGDPTLRLHRLTPPARPRATREGQTVRLQWDASPEPDCGYFVYRSTDGLAGFTGPVNATPVSQAAFEDSTDAKKVLYQIRAARLQVTGSGSFTNLSQGVFVEVR